MKIKMKAVLESKEFKEGVKEILKQDDDIKTANDANKKANEIVNDFILDVTKKSETPMLDDTQRMISIKDLQHKAFRLQREIEKINKDRKLLTNELFKVHHQLHAYKLERVKK